MRSDVVKCGYIQLSVIGTSHNITVYHLNSNTRFDPDISKTMDVVRPK
jgi:hypothetical protein